MHCIRYIQNPAIFTTLSIILNSDIFRHIHLLFTLSHIMTYLEPCVTLAYSKPCHIQKPSTFRTRDIFSTLSRHILPYLERCVTFAYWESRILAYFRPKAYSELYQTSEMKGLTKLVKGYKYSSTTFHLSCLTRIWTRLCLKKC